MRISALAVLLGAISMICAMPSGAQQDDAFEAMRREMLSRQRRVILNNDGGDAVVTLKEPTREAMLAARSYGLEDTHVDTIFYCTNRGTFARHSHASEVSETFMSREGRYSKNVTPVLIEQGTDPLQVMIDWCRENDREIFWSERMNDRHDAGNGMLSEWKLAHPECLVGSADNRPPHGAWTQVDYSHQAVRDQMFAMIEEVCRKYDMDGIEMDFFRHAVFFKSVAWGEHATDEQRAIMTGFVRRVREMTERVGRERGRPILVAIRTVDSVPLASAMGLDLEAWLSEGLVDIVTGSGYFRMNPWNYLAQLGDRHDVLVYAGLSDSRVTADTSLVNRRSQDSYRGRAARAWQAGVDGIYLFNMFNPRMEFLHHIGDPEVLAGLDKTCFATVRGGGGYGDPDYWVEDGSQWRNTPLLTPEKPLSLPPGATASVPLYLGDERGLDPTETCYVMATGDPQVSLNGQALTDATVEKQWLLFTPPEGLLRPGRNIFEFAAPEADADAEASRWVEWTADTIPQAPWRHGNPRGGRTLFELQDEGLLVADRGEEPGDYLYFTYPWEAGPDQLAVGEAEVKVIDGWNNFTLGNGEHEERVTLYPDHIGTHYTRLRYDMDTTGAFHTYRVEIEGDDIRIYVDGELRIDGEGQFTHDAGGRNRASFGAANSPSTGEAIWRSVRLSSPGTRGAQVYDLAVRMQFGEGQ